jgi:hypothetical protein
MALQTFNANDLVYTVSPELPLQDGRKTWAVVSARIFDEITGLPPESDITIQSSFSGISPRTAPGGLVGFAGIPVRAFPSLKLTGYIVPIAIQAEGYIPVFRDVPIAQNAAFPDAFVPTDLGTLGLHRLPAVITGRVMLNTGTELQGIALATIKLTGIWQTPPPANMIVPPAPPDLISLTPGIYFDRALAGTQVQGLNFLGAPGPDKQLLQEAEAGQTSLYLSDRMLMAAGDVLAIDAQDAERTEYITIQSLAGASTADQPATITLDTPLHSVHRPGAIVHKVQFANVGVVTLLSRDATAGDVCLFVNGVGNLGGASLISVQSAGHPTEYHAVSYFGGLSDAQGFFRLPGLSRVAQCAFRSHDGVHADIDITFSPDYSEEANRIDFVYH